MHVHDVHHNSRAHVTVLSLQISLSLTRNMNVTVGLPHLRNLVNVYLSSSNRNDSIYTEFPDLIFLIRQISKITLFFLKNSLKNVLCAKGRNCLVGCCDRIHFKLLESDCKMRNLVYSLKQ